MWLKLRREREYEEMLAVAKPGDHLKYMGLDLLVTDVEKETFQYKARIACTYVTKEGLLQTVTFLYPALGVLKAEQE